MGKDGKLQVPDHPIIPFIEGDGTGPDITRASMIVWNAAVEKAYGGKRKVEWMEIYAGEKANAVYGKPVWLPPETLDACREFLVSIKGPLTTPVGGGIRSLNVALRQELDLYVCLRPVRWFEGVPSPVKRPELTDMVIFRENTEDIYAGIEWAAGTPEVKKVDRFPAEGNGREEDPVPGIVRHRHQAGFARTGRARLVQAAIRYAIDSGRKSVTLVHKGNIMKFTEGAFRDWGYQVAREQFGAEPLDGGPWLKMKNPKAATIS